MPKPHRSATVLVVMLAGCVSVNDLRDSGQDLDVPIGQVDTGWKADASAPELPPPIACDTAADCTEWMGELTCHVAVCESGLCAAAALADGLPCSDGDVSTRGDRCGGGQCVPGPDVCVCASDEECRPFDDGGACDGRLACDGCGCVPVATPVGSSCDDGDPGTVDDVCIDARTCAGTTPCGCTASTDCPTSTCMVAVCTDCTCLGYSDVPGTVYASASAANGIPAGWTSDGTNPLVQWRGSASGGVRATGPDGSYDHGAATASLRSPAIAVPAGAAILELRVGLLSADEGCDDRLELRFGDVLLDTLCGAVAVGRRTYPLAGDQSGSLSLAFITNDTDNAGAGAVFEDATWRRVAPSACGGVDAERAVPSGPGSLEVSPDIAAAPEGGWNVAWEDETGVHLRRVTAGPIPSGDAQQLDPAGRAPSLARGWAAWERGGDVVVRPLGGTSSLEYTLAGARVPDLDALGEAAPVIAVLTPTGTAELRTPTGSVLAQAEDALYPGRAAMLDEGFLVAATTEGVVAYSASGTRALPGPTAVGRPDASVGLARIGVAWPTAAGVHVVTDRGEEADIDAPGATEVALTNTAFGWVAVWVVSESQSLAGSLLTGTLTAALPLASVATFPGVHTSPRLASDGDHAVAVWEAPWLDGDDATIAVRRLPDPLVDQ